MYFFSFPIDFNLHVDLRTQFPNYTFKKMGFSGR